MIIDIEKRGDHWWLIVNENADIKTPYKSSVDRNAVVGYAKRAFPNAMIRQRAD